MLDSFFNPRSVAVIGASMKPRSLGHVLLKNIAEAERWGTPNFPTPKRTARALSVLLKKS